MKVSFGDYIIRQIQDDNVFWYAGSRKSPPGWYRNRATVYNKDTPTPRHGYRAKASNAPAKCRLSYPYQHGRWTGPRPVPWDAA